MAACLSGTGKRKKKNKSGNNNNNNHNNNTNIQRNNSHLSASFPNINGIKQKNGHRKQIKNENNKHLLIPSSSKHNVNEDYEWIQQQKLLISRIQLKPNQYLILSQKDIHDTIDKILSKYPNASINWHWFNGRFEPVLNDNHHTLLTQKSINAHSRNNTMELNQYHVSSLRGHNHHGHNHEFHDHSSVNTMNTTMTGATTNTKSRKHLLRMNGQHCVKCKSCFRKTMKREYLTQKDILFLIKYSLKFFIQYRGEHKHQCSWKQKLEHQQATASYHQSFGPMYHPHFHPNHMHREYTPNHHPNPHLLHPNYNHHPHPQHNGYHLPHPPQSKSKSVQSVQRSPHRRQESISSQSKPIHDETGMIIHNDDEITKFHSNFKHSKALLPNLHPPTQHTHSTDMIIEEEEHEHEQPQHPSSSEYNTGKNAIIMEEHDGYNASPTNTTTNTQHMENNHEDSFVHQPQNSDLNNSMHRHNHHQPHSRTRTGNSTITSISTLSGIGSGNVNSNNIAISRTNNIDSDSTENNEIHPHKAKQYELSQSRSAIDILNEHSKSHTHKKISSQSVVLQESKSVPVDMKMEEQQQAQLTPFKTKKRSNPSKYQQYQQQKKKDSKKTKQLKHELSNIKSNYHAMLKDYNKLQNFLVKRGIQYDDNDDDNQQNIANTNIDSLKSENQRLLTQIEQLKSENTEIERKYTESQNENERLKSVIQQLQQRINDSKTKNIHVTLIDNQQALTPSVEGSIVIHDTPNHNHMNSDNVPSEYSPISPLIDDDEQDDHKQYDTDSSSLNSSDDDGASMLQRIFQGSDDEDGYDNFYYELTTLYDFPSQRQNSKTASVLQLKELNVDYDSDGEDFQIVNNNIVRQSSILDILQLSSPNSNLLVKRPSNSYQSYYRSGRNIAKEEPVNHRKRSQSNSLLPVNSVVELQQEESKILQNEFNLFRLLIDDKEDEQTKILNLTLKKRRGSVNHNYLGIDALIDHVCSNEFDNENLCNFLPLILFKASKCEKEITSKSSKHKTKGNTTKTNASLVLISRLSKENRLWDNDDIRQKLQFLSNAFQNQNKTKNKKHKDKHKDKKKNKDKDGDNPIQNLFDHSHKIWLQKQTEKLHNSKSPTLTDLSYDISAARNKLDKLDGDDLITFWESIMDLKEADDKRIDDEETSFNYRDPVIPGLPPLRKVIVVKELKSANKPILCELYVENGIYQQHRRMSDINENSTYNEVKHNDKDLVLSSHVILKKGDDLRKDYAIMNIFKYMNYIWKKERENKFFSQFKNLEYGGSIVKILTFNVVPFNEEFGAIELIANCVPLRHVNHLKKDMKNEHFYQLITSAAASYIGAFVCGIRDRHFENILIRVADCTLFHIDFGYCVGEKIKFAIDASPFGITNQLKQLMNHYSSLPTNDDNIDLYKDKFVPIAVDAYMSLRKNYKSLIKFAQLAFSYIKKEKDIQSFIKDRLKIFDNDKKKEKKWTEQYVQEWITKQLQTAPKDTKTIRKNKLRKFLSPTMVDIDKQLKEDQEKRDKNKSQSHSNNPSNNNSDNNDV